MSCAKAPSDRGSTFGNMLSHLIYDINRFYSTIFAVFELVMSNACLSIVRLTVCKQLSLHACKLYAFHFTSVWLHVVLLSLKPFRPIQPTSQVPAVIVT
jgi:hypothetical protein